MITLWGFYFSRVPTHVQQMCPDSSQTCQPDGPVGESTVHQSCGGRCSWRSAGSDQTRLTAVCFPLLLLQPHGSLFAQTHFAAGVREK